MTEMTTGHLVEHLVSALEGGILHDVPWSHCYLEQALPATTAADIAATFHDVELSAVEARNVEKTYRMRTRRVDLTTAIELPSAHWRSFLDALADPRYRSAITDLTGVDLAGTEMTIDLWEYRDGDWLAAHVDKPEKVVTQLFYFARNWHPEAGAHLLVLNSASTEDAPFERLPPITGSSAVLVRSESSWHAVEAGRDPAVARCSVAVTFWRRLDDTEA